MIQESKYLHEIERIQNLMGVNAVNEQISVGNLLTPIGGMGGSLKAFNWFKSFNEHDWLTFVDITTGLLGMIPSPAAPFLLGASLVACQADAALYFKENDPYMGGLVLSFCLIPLGEWIRVAPGSKSVLIKGKQYAIDLLKKAKSLSGKKVLDTTEKAIIKESDTLIKSLTEKADEIAKLTQKYFVTKVISKIITTGGKTLFGTALLLSKMSWAIGRPILQLGGIYYTFDEVYLAMYGTDKEKLRLRYNSGFQYLVRLVKVLANQETIEKQLEDYIELNKETLQNNPQYLASIDCEKRQEAIEQNKKETEEFLKKREQEERQSPSIENVLSKKIDPKTNRPYTIREGQRGESVRKIQEMLEKLELGETLKGYKEENVAVDGDFGENTFNAVAVFQWENNLESTGEVDSETLKTLKIKIQELNNKNEK